MKTATSEEIRDADVAQLSARIEVTTEELQAPCAAHRSDEKDVTK